ncbi:MAG: ATP-binding cassette domain-containing protein, partial [Candidatus Dormibacteraceae bacterium]
MVATDSPPAVRAMALAAGYGGPPIWQGANFALPEGSFCAVLGPNGAGKSTLIRLLLGLQKPLLGRIEVMGSAPRRGNSSIGYVPQASAFDLDFSIRGRDYVRLGLD